LKQKITAFLILFWNFVGQIFFLVIFSKVFIELKGKQKWCRKHFKLLDYSSNQMKKKLRLMWPVTSVTSKNQWKNYIFSSNLFKNEDFLKNSKTNYYLNYLEKLVEQHFTKTLFDASESAKNTFFVTSPKLKILIKNVLLYRKRTKKVYLNIFALVDQNPQWKG
jgi:hypothetical protein